MKHVLIGMLCRVISGFSLGAVCILSATFAATTIAQPVESPRPSSYKGYSIFHETMADMTWPEIEQAGQAGAIILFPLAVIEEHGPHMALGVDSYLITLQTQLLRRELEARGIHVLIAPPLLLGDQPRHSKFPRVIYCA